MTVAISLLVHGEAVRFNRGQSRGDDYDFKYMRGRDGKEYPYVSSQCFKRYWREALPGPPSPITRARGTAGQEKNQAYTDGNPITYVDDDLFGYMIAGAAEFEEEREDLESLEADGEQVFEAESLKGTESLRKKLLSDHPISNFIQEKSPGVRDILQSESSSSEAIQDAIITALNAVVKSPDLPESVLKENWFTEKKRRKFREAKTETKREMISELLRWAYKGEFQTKPKRLTTRRTAPLRMH